MCCKTAQGRRAHAPTGHDMLLRCDAAKANALNFLAIVTCKNKGKEEVSYFVGGKGKNKGKKGPKSNSAAAAHSSSSNVNLPFAVITTLLSMSISLLSSQADMPLMVEYLKTKKAWFEANQACMTAQGHHKESTQACHTE